MSKRPPLPKSLPLPTMGRQQMSLFEQVVIESVGSPPLRLTPEQRQVVPNPPPPRTPPPARAFDGKTYDPLLDYQRLGVEMQDVWSTLVRAPGTWRTLTQIQTDILSRTARLHGESGISARLRDLRKERWGAYTVQCERRKGGTYVYRLDPQELALRQARAKEQGR